jgi:hypothetical protein
MQSQILEEGCIELIERGGRKHCTKLIRLRAGGASLFIELVKKDPDSGEEAVRVLAELPRETYAVAEPYFDGYFVAYEGKKLVAASSDWNSFLRRLREMGYYISHSSYLKDSPFLMPRVEKTISAGLSDSGDVVDPFGVLDATDYGAEPLKAAYAWVRSMYAGRNAAYAWYNVIAVVTQVAASPLRKLHHLRNHYLDYVVYNVGISGLNMAMYILEPMLGGRYANEAYNTVIYGAPLLARKGSKHLAAQLLDMNRLPLVLAGQTKKTLEVYKYLLESACGGFVELSGRRKVPNLRSLFVFADELYDIPARSLVMQWEHSQIRPPPPTGLPPVKPVYGFAARLWKKYRKHLAGPNKLPYLVKVAAKAIAQEIRNEAEEVATFTESTVAELVNAFARRVVKVEKSSVALRPTCFCSFDAKRNVMF